MSKGGIAVDDYDPYNANIVRDPATGRITETTTPEQYRGKNPRSVWLYNPWTGLARSVADLLDDPYGLRLRHYRNSHFGET